MKKHTQKCMEGNFIHYSICQLLYLCSYLINIQLLEYFSVKKNQVSSYLRLVHYNFHLQSHTIFFFHSFNKRCLIFLHKNTSNRLYFKKDFINVKLNFYRLIKNCCPGCWRTDTLVVFVLILTL